MRGAAAVETLALEPSRVEDPTGRAAQMSAAIMFEFKRALSVVQAVPEVQPREP